MEKSEIVFYDANNTANRIDIDITPIIRSTLKLIFMIKSEISKDKTVQFVIKSPYGKAIINEDGVKMIEMIFSSELFGGVNKLNVDDVYDDGD